MSMLAEPRRKVKWVLNPRQTAWSNDSTKFGQKYLEKLGWTAGQGIGANLQGCTEHVKVSVRSDNRGVGFKGIPEDMLPHQNDFSELLTQLATTSSPVLAESNEERSLVVKSRKSKARVHYHKFTHSKDLTTYSPKDLACILGKPTRPKVDAVPVDIQESAPCEPNFVQRGNMQEYFSGKMKSSCINFVKENDADKCKNDNFCTGFGINKRSDDRPPSPTDSEQPDSKDEPNVSVTKSKKKRKACHESVEELDNKSLPADCMVMIPTPEQPYSKDELNISDKKLKRKRKACHESVEELDDNKSLPADCMVTIPTPEQPYSKDELNISDKKSKKKRKPCHESVEELNDNKSLSADCMATIPITEQPYSKDELNVSDKKSKKKRKAYHKSGEELDDNKSLSADCMATILIPEQPYGKDELNINDKKSKKKRRTYHESLEELDNNKSLSADCMETVPIPVPATVNKVESNVIDKKLRKKSRQQSEGSPETEDNVHITDCTESKQVDKSAKEYVKTPRKKQKVNGCTVDEGESLPPEMHCSEDKEQGDESEIIKKSRRKKRKRVESEDISDCLHELDSSKTLYLMPNEVELNKKKSKKKKYSFGENMECLDDEHVRNHKEGLMESVHLSGRGVKKCYNSITPSSTEPSQPTDSIVRAPLLGNEEKQFENIEISRKKKERIDIVAEVESIDEACQTSRRVVDKDLNETKKRRKKSNTIEEDGDSNGCLSIEDCRPMEAGVSSYYDVEYTTESAGKLEKKQKKHTKISAEGESKGSLKKSKKMKIINGESLETHHGDGCLLLIDGTESMQPEDSDKMSNENVKLSHKKVRKNTLSRSDEDEPSLPIDADSTNNGQGIKCVRFSKPLSSEVLIPCREQSKEDTMSYAISNDCMGKLARALAKNESHLNSSHRHVIYVKNTIVGKSKKTVEAKVMRRSRTKYMNGIAKCNIRLKRRLTYAFDSCKMIPSFQRSTAFSGFPGSNIEQLGYGKPNTNSY